MLNDFEQFAIDTILDKAWFQIFAFDIIADEFQRKNRVG